MFSINNAAFEEGLDRFSNFFKEPLFNPSGVSRELQAIDQEYAKNLENDDVRAFYVDKSCPIPIIHTMTFIQATAQPCPRFHKIRS